MHSNIPLRTVYGGGLWGMLEVGGADVVVDPPDPVAEPRPGRGRGGARGQGRGPPLPGGYQMI